MNNYQSKKLIPMPEPKPYHKMTDKELQNLLKSNVNYNVLIPVLIEINLRQNMEILSTTIYLWLITLTASKELSILLLKLLECR